MRNIDIINRSPHDNPQEIDFSTPPPKEVSEPIDGKLPEVEDMLFGAFLAGEDGMEEEDEPTWTVDNAVAEGGSIREKVEDTTLQSDSQGEAKRSKDDTNPSDQPPKTPDTAGNGEGGGDNGPGDKAAPGEEGDEEGMRMLRNMCIGDARILLNKIDPPGQELPPPDDTELLNKTLVDLANIDPDNARTYGERLQYPAHEEIAGMYAARIRAGDEAAADGLREAIEAEGRTAEAWEATREALRDTDEPQDTAHSSDQPLLDAAIKVYENHGQSPQELIDAGVANIDNEAERDTARRLLFLRHAGRVVPGGGDYAEGIKEEANRAAREILSRDGDILKETPYVLRAATDSELRQELLDRYAEKYSIAIRYGHIDPKVANALFEATPDILKDPHLSPEELAKVDEIVRHTEAVLEEMTFKVKKPGKVHELPPMPAKEFDPLVRQAAEWRIDHAMHTGASAESVAELCYAETSQRLKGLNTDELLARGAQEFMKRGDVESARRLCYASQSMEGRHAIMRTCWRYTTTVPQIDRLSPLPETPQEQLTAPSSHPHPTLETRREHNFIAASRKGPQVLEQHARSIAKGSYIPPASYTKTEAVGMLMKRLSNIGPKEAVTFARNETGHLIESEAEITLQDLQPYLETLSTKGDFDDRLFARNVINKATGTKVEKLHAFTQLARKLRPENKH